MVNSHAPITSQELDISKPNDPGFVHLPSGARKDNSSPSLLNELEDLKELTLPSNVHFDTPTDASFLTQAPPQLVASNSPLTSSISSPNESGLSSPLPLTPINPNSVEQNGVIHQAPPANSPSASMPGNSTDLSQCLVDKLQDVTTYVSNVGKYMNDDGEKAYQQRITEESTENGIDMKKAGRVQKNRIRAKASRARQKREDQILKTAFSDISSNLEELMRIAYALRNARKRKQPLVQPSVQMPPSELENNSSSMTDATEISSPEEITRDSLTPHFDSVNAHCESTMPSIDQVFIVASRSQSFDKHSTGDLLSVTTSLPTVETNLDEFVNSA